MAIQLVIGRKIFQFFPPISISPGRRKNPILPSSKKTSPAINRIAPVKMSIFAKSCDQLFIKISFHSGNIYRSIGIKRICPHRKTEQIRIFSFEMFHICNPFKNGGLICSFHIAEKMFYIVLGQVFQLFSMDKFFCKVKNRP